MKFLYKFRILPLFFVLVFLVCCSQVNQDVTSSQGGHSTSSAGLAPGSSSSTSSPHLTDAPPITDISVPDSSERENTASMTANTGKVLTLPYRLDEGKLEVTALYQSTISNPDCEFTMAENIASLEVVNRSIQHLTFATFDILLSSGQTIHFVINDLPAGETVWAFSTENTAIPANTNCISISAETVYEERTPLLHDLISIETQGTTATIRNVSGVALHDLQLSFHCYFEGVCFGGTTYVYRIEYLSQEETILLDIAECFLGQAFPVRVSTSHL